MLKLLALAITISLVASASDSQWAVFKAKHNKIYLQDEDLYRRAIYEDNLKTIQTHNDLFAKGKRSFYLGENQFTDLTTAEFTKMMNGFKPALTRQADPQKTSSIFSNSNSNISLPTTVNWAKRGYVTKVKNQGRCGSCWAFSTTGSLEGAHRKATGKLVELSEKNLIDCSTSFGNHGCHGGLMDNAFRYIIRNRGIDTERSYPYVPEEDKCRFRRSTIGATMNSYVQIPRGSERDLQHALATVGPVSVAIDAGHLSFQQYSGGVYNEPRCSTTRLDHGVLVVGYGSESGRSYWLVKNSWGESWGMGGYIKMSRNNGNQCGIATIASYPVV